MYDYPDGPDSFISAIDLKRNEINDDLFDAVGFRLTDRLASQFYDEYFRPEKDDFDYPF